MTNESSPTALLEFQDIVKTRVQYRIGGIFFNSNPAFAHVVTSEFLDAAKEHIHIFCGKLSNTVYYDTLPFFQKAYDRGVDIRVITCCPFEQLECVELASWLKENNLWMCVPEKASHFMEIDGIMYRLETDDVQKAAIVCANVYIDPDDQAAMKELVKTFDNLWEQGLNNRNNS